MSFSLSQLSFRVFVDRHATSLAKQVMTHDMIPCRDKQPLVRQGETPYHALTFFFFFDKIIEEKQLLQTLVPLNLIVLTYIDTDISYLVIRHSHL